MASGPAGLGLELGRAGEHATRGSYPASRIWEGLDADPAITRSSPPALVFPLGLWEFLRRARPAASADPAQGTR